MVISLFEKKKRHLQGTDRTLVTEHESKGEGVGEQLGLCGVWLESPRRWATTWGVRRLLGETELGYGMCTLRCYPLMEVCGGGGPWVPWWGLCVAGRQPKGTGPLGVGKHSVLIAGTL